MFAVNMDQRRHHSIPNSENSENFNSYTFPDLNKYHNHHQQHIPGSGHSWNPIFHDAESSNVSSHPSSSATRGMDMNPRFASNSDISSKGKNVLDGRFEGGNNVINPREQIQGFIPQAESSMRNSSEPGMISLQMESPLGQHRHYHHHHHHHHNYGHLYPGNYVPRVWMQYGVTPGDGIPPAWNYPNMIPCFPGRNLNTCSEEVTVGLQNPNASYLGVQTAYGLPMPVNNMFHPAAFHSDPLWRNLRPLPFSSSMRSYRSNRRPSQSMTSTSGIRQRISRAEEFNNAELRSFYGAENFFDRHRDMRLDIDNMSYEELLALGERIGEVKTGLSRNAISNHLKTRDCHLPESESCIVCQEEYLENQTIGTLICGHEYHEDCITEWLLVKNLCPVCKATAVPADKSKR